MKHLRSLLVALLGLATLPSVAQAARLDSNLYFSEYVEGSSNNKALEIYNAGSEAVDLQTCRISIFFNGADTAGASVDLRGSIAAGDVFVVVNSQASPELQSRADFISGALAFNGDDAIILICDIPKSGEGTTELMLDSIGKAREQKVWGSGEVLTRNKTLRRKSSVSIGDRDPRDNYDPTLEWDGFPEDTFDGLGIAPTNNSTPAPAPLLGGFGLFVLAGGLVFLRPR